MNKVVTLLSGGLDSVTLLHYIRANHPTSEIHALSFDYGQKHDIELKYARMQADIVGAVFKHYDLNILRDIATQGHSALVDTSTAVPELDDVLGHPQPITYVPFRNLIFLSLAASYAESISAIKIYYGAQRADAYGYWDCTPGFVASLERVFALNRQNPIRLAAPFVSMHKQQIVETGLSLGVDYQLTWSCYNGPDEFNRACGRCPTCCERLEAFRRVSVDDPIAYVDDDEVA